MSSLYERFVIGPGVFVSTFCSSVFRIEPYYFCDFGCIYCYARRIIKNIPPLEFGYNLLKAFRKLLKVLKSRGVPIPVFRMSTLTEPFQNIEKRLMISLKFLNECIRNNCKLIINTKSMLILDEPWIDRLIELNRNRNVLIQLSIMGVDDEKIKRVEPNAPPVSKRIEMIKELSKIGIPVIVRIQPIIPGFNDEDAFDLIVEAYRFGAKQVIIEFLKLADIEELNIISKAIGLEIRKSLFYKPEFIDQYIVKSELRAKLLFSYLETARAKGIEFSTCKEGFIKYHTAEDCCGMHHLGKYVAKKTVSDVLLGKKKNKIIIEGEILEKMPHEIKKKVKKHYQILNRILSEKINELLLDIETT